jgi:hypothetical protein
MSPEQRKQKSIGIALCFQNDRVFRMIGEERPQFRHSQRLLVPAYRFINNPGYADEG